jgi:hypothetical protein
VARIAVLAALYIFLAAVMRVAWRDVASAVPRHRGSIGRAFLVVVEGAGKHLRVGDRITIEGAATIGRDSDNQMMVDDTTVSGRHAAVFYRDGRWWLEDLGSTNGTWVNGQPIQSTEPVSSGDLIQIGRVSFRLS